eukprot:TRINITY_DN1797_c0_g1_i1.p1 TRINITY_DN1797_c0_g1~~TRINITY_DN1797_c0_g1_i1.p1  ORF type:complete len:119 (-),score=15.72 TRINITY_DN1797_c0_g1_i1:80-436(-)
MSFTRDFVFRAGCYSAALGVLIGAFGAHKIKSIRAQNFLEAWQTGVQWHMIHSLALIAASKAPRHSPLASQLFLVGIFLFSGSLYALTLTENRKLGMITPIGGLSFVAGWIALAIQGV